MLKKSIYTHVAKATVTILGMGGQGVVDGNIIVTTVQFRAGLQ